LADAQADYERCRRELGEAIEWSDVVEEKWGVVCLDSDDSCDGDEIDAVPIVSAVSRESDETDNHDDDEMIDGSIMAVREEECSSSLQRQMIQIVNAGEDIVNGLYYEQQCTYSSTTSRINSSGCGDVRHSQSNCIYIHTAGPHLIGDIYHDVCLFQKYGYGDKFRWCLGLVPCNYTGFYPTDLDDAVLTDTTTAKEGNESCSQREWRLDRAYIYYWMEAPHCFTSSVQSQDDSSGGSHDSHASMSLFQNEWNACHGARPVPFVKDGVDSSDGIWLWWNKLLRSIQNLVK
jgi:hypothetical protein